MSKKIPLTKGKYAIVEDDDMLDWLSQWKWLVSRYDYAVRSQVHEGTRTTIWMHRLIMDAPDDMQVDHIDHDTLNNRRENLRLATHSQNNMNQRPTRGGTSQFKGVFYRRDLRRWQARIVIETKTISLGIFESELDAAQAYNDAAPRYFGEFACLNDLENTPLSKLSIVRKKRTPARFTGVRFIEQTGVWRARLTVNGQQFSRSGFYTQFEAAIYRLKLEREHLATG